MMCECVISERDAPLIISFSSSLPPCLPLSLPPSLPASLPASLPPSLPSLSLSLSLYSQHANLAGTLSGHSSWVLSVAYCPDNQQFVLCGFSVLCVCVC